jgi:hypothetical protein
MAANPVTQPTIDIPRHVWDAVNNAIHTSKIDGCVQPISLCYVAVRAAIAASANPELLEALKDQRQLMFGYKSRLECDGSYVAARQVDDRIEMVSAVIAKAEGK